MENLETIRKKLIFNLRESEGKGWDPFDGLAGPIGLWLCKKKEGRLRSFARLALLQGVKRCPMNLRSILRIPKLENAMFWAVVLLGDLEAIQNEEESAFNISHSVDRILFLRHDTGLWGYPFPWESRAFYVEANHPNLVISSLCLRALLESYRSGHLDTTQKQRVEESIKKALPALNSLFLRETFYSYVDHDAVLVHNANLFAVEILLHSITLGLYDIKNLHSILKALNSTLALQENNGRWSYGTAEHHQWCDNFHTAYNLVSLIRIKRFMIKLNQNVMADKIIQAINKGSEYYLNVAFEKDGTAKYYDNQTFPIESHSYAAAMICLSELTKSGLIPSQDYKEKLNRVFQSLSENLYLKKGKFSYRKNKFFTLKTVFSRWTQAWLYQGFTARY